MAFGAKVLGCFDRNFSGILWWVVGALGYIQSRLAKLAAGMDDDAHVHHCRFLVCGRLVEGLLVVIPAYQRLVMS